MEIDIFIIIFAIITIVTINNKFVNSLSNDPSTTKINSNIDKMQDSNYLNKIEEDKNNVTLETP